MFARFNYRKGRFHVLGALGGEGGSHGGDGDGADLPYRFYYNNMNSDTFIDFVDSLHRKYGKLLLFFDRASYHTSEKVRRYFSEHRDDIKFALFPACSPELNPIETQWREWRRLLGNKYFEGREEMAGCLDRRVKNGDGRKIRLFAYLSC